MSENSTNNITEAEEQIPMVTKMLVSTAGPGASQDLYTPQPACHAMKTAKKKVEENYRL